MKSGWVKTYRQLAEWEWYQDSQMVHLLIHLIIEANHADLKWRGITIKRGQLLTSRKKLSVETGISEQSIRTCLDRLQSTNEITVRSTNLNTVIAINKYDIYQANETEINQPTNQRSPSQTTNDQPTTNQPTNKNYKNDKKDKNNIVGVKKTPATLHTVCKNLFIEKFRQLFGEEYYWEAKDGANLNPIIKKIKFNREKKEMPIDDESISVAFSLFLDSITDKWLLENFSIPNINSKFNEIISQAKNGRTKQQNTRPSPSELEAAVEIGMALAAGNR